MCVYLFSGFLCHRTMPHLEYKPCVAGMGGMKGIYIYQCGIFLYKNVDFMYIACQVELSYAF